MNGRASRQGPGSLPVHEVKVLNATPLCLPFGKVAAAGCCEVQLDSEGKHLCDRAWHAVGALKRSILSLPYSLGG